MAVPVPTFTLAPNPFWYIADNVGRPAGAAKMYTWRSLNKTQPKAIFEDPAGNFPWPNPVNFNENGQDGPFYWEFDPSNPDETYYVEVFDKDGNLIWNIDDFPGDLSGGGSGPITESFDLANQITNGVFWRNIGSISPVPTFATIAPGNHDNIFQPDITFQKNNTAATDTLTFVKFPLGSTALTGDVTPEFYLEYVCSNNPVGETFKYVQAPVNAHVQNLSNNTMTFSIWARGTVGTVTLQLQWYQFFGNGVGASAPATTIIAIQTLSPSWTKYTFQSTIPDVTGKVLGGCGDDGTYLQIGFPLGNSCNINVAKPALYLGNVAPGAEFISYDQISSITDSPRTGDIRTSLNAFYPYGWVPMNDGTIGNASSNATTRANIDTFSLYSIIWNISATYAPLFDSTGASAVRGANAAADFVANNQLSLTKTLGRVMAGMSPLGQTSQTFTASSVTSELTLTSTVNYFTGNPISFTTTGTLPAPLVIGVTYYAIQLTSTTIKVATTAANAAIGTFITLTTNGAPTNTVTTPPYVLGQYQGEEAHTLTVAEMPSHKHTQSPFQSGGATIINLPNNGSGTADAFSIQTQATGGDGAHNTIQPTVYYNIFAKL